MCFDHCEGDAFDPLQDLLDAKVLVEANPVGYLPEPIYLVPALATDNANWTVPIMRLNEPIPNCDEGCRYGTCGGSGYNACGGCCGCRGGCVVEHENAQWAPFLWEGDYS